MTVDKEFQEIYQRIEAMSRVCLSLLDMGIVTPERIHEVSLGVQSDNLKDDYPDCTNALYEECTIRTEEELINTNV